MYLKNIYVAKYIMGNSSSFSTKTSNIDEALIVYDKFLSDRDVIKKINFVDFISMSMLQSSYLAVISSCNEYKNKTKIESIYNDYGKILTKLDNLKKTKIDFYNDEYKKNLKYIDYALEECNTSYLFMMSVIDIDDYNIDYYNMYKIDNIINNLITNNIQKHSFCISTQLNIPHVIFEINDRDILNIINSFYDQPVATTIATTIAKIVNIATPIFMSNVLKIVVEQIILHVAKISEQYKLVE